MLCGVGIAAVDSHQIQEFRGDDDAMAYTMISSGPESGPFQVMWCDVGVGLKPACSRLSGSWSSVSFSPVHLHAHAASTFARRIHHPEENVQFLVVVSWPQSHVQCVPVLVVALSQPNRARTHTTHKIVRMSTNESARPLPAGTNHERSHIQDPTGVFSALGSL